MSYHEQLEDALLFTQNYGHRLRDEQFARDLIAEYRALYQRRYCDDCGWEDYRHVSEPLFCPSCDNAQVEVLP